MAIAMQNYIKDIEKLVSVLTIEAHMSVHNCLNRNKLANYILIDHFKVTIRHS